ncbi:MAG TPA: TIGR02302 family protein [Methyloceanibacter sp.]|nr:TIGR02302 family protein [Methyloceanibacter sp.]
MRNPFAAKKSTPDASEDNALARRFEWRVALSRLALVGEHVWEALLWPFLVVAVFLILSLLDLWSIVPPLLHRGLLLAFGIAFLVSLLPLIRFPMPTRAEALRRLERNAEIKHRPASSYEDRLGTTPRGDTAILWAAHRERLAKLVAKLKPSWPVPRTDRKDPYAIRAALLLVLVVAALAAGPDRWGRIASAFTPAANTATALLRLDAWVTPPVYTGIAPIVLADGSEPVGAGAETFRALSVPERSELLVRVFAPRGESVSLVTQPDDGTEPKMITPRSTGSQGLMEFNMALTSPGAADVKVGGNTVAKWRFDLIKDSLPQIGLMGNPTTTPRGALRLSFRATDDHGVASAEARFALAGTEASPAPVPELEGGKSNGKAKAEPNPLLEAPLMPLQLPKVNVKQVEGKASQDLTAHPWAGLKVRMILAARDQAGQTGLSEPYEFILPERNFTKPLAKAVVEQRKKLVREPDSSSRVAMALDALTIGDERAIPEMPVYLALRDAYWRLDNDESPESIASVVSQLWELALRIEDGNIPQAERDVKAAQEKLAEALKQGASPEEIQRLVDELRNALGRYLQALAEQAQQKGNLPEQKSQDGEQVVSDQELDKLLDNIEKLAKSGSKDMAEQMLSELKDILERLQTGTFSDNAKQQRAGKMMKDLNDLVSKQQKLLDETFKAKREQGGQQQDGAFNVSPPGQPMEFGPGIFMAPFGTPQEDGQDGGMSPEGNENSQGQSGGRNSQQQGRQQKGQSPGQFDDLGQRQGELKEALQSLIDRFRIEGANPPEQFQDAGEAMGEAKEALGKQKLDRATEEQNNALDQLRQGAQSLAEQMMENGEAQAGKGQGNSGKDPLGRPDRSNRPDLGLSVNVPDEIDIQKAREVLDELRRRLGDPSRPIIELDYLERLIRSY